MWGQEIYDKLTEVRARIMPTRVGTRQSVKRYLRSLRDHPHACGDKAALSLIMTVAQGSSPRVWGQGFCSVWSDMDVKIIPTRVGTRIDGLQKLL